MYIYIYIYILYRYVLYIYIYISLYIYLYIVIVCDHETTHTSSAICRDQIYIKLYGPCLWMRCNCLKTRQSYYEEIVYFLAEILGTHQINIGKIKAEMTLQPSSGFELVYQSEFSFISGSLIKKCSAHM